VRIALVGTRGVPARYGGFETAAEEIGVRLVEAGHDVTVYTRSRGNPEYRGIHTVYLPTIRTKYTETLAHGFFSVCHALIRRPDVAIVFNAANSPAATFLRLAGVPYALHVDGLEWKRSKWSGAGRTYYLLAERLAVHTANALIADSRGISDYYANRYGVETDLIPYGAPVRHVDRTVEGRLREADLAFREYHLIVARLEPENHVTEILKGYWLSNAQFPLVVVGSAPYNDRYQRELERLAQADSRVRLTGAVWDQELLDSLYLGCASYLHGHSVGGTNPSLLRAAGAGAFCIAYDVSFNREVLGDDAVYFESPTSVRECVEHVEEYPRECATRGTKLRDSVVSRYDWDDVALRYEALCCALAATSKAEVVGVPESAG
jgi:glycosyltransferase involved in cell wall biosynthesis